jgi:NitT/TauT family transport system substrate-binding protein
VSGQWQFGFSNVVSLLLAQSRNVPIKVVANGNNSTGDTKNDFGGIVVKDPAITSPKQLEGKKVATNALKNIVDTSVKDIVKKDGGDPSKVNFVELAFPDMAAQLEAGNVDAIFVVEPFLSAAKAKGWKVIGLLRRRRPEPVRGAVFHLQGTDRQEPGPRQAVHRRDERIAGLRRLPPDEVRAVLGTYTQITEASARALTAAEVARDINSDAINKLS